MKPVRIDFIENQHWLLVWVVAGVLVVGLMGGAVWLWAQTDREMREQIDRIGDAERRLQELRVVPLPIRPDPRRVSLDEASRFLRQDFNKAFATVENLNEPGVRLRALNLEAGSNTLRLEYDLDSIAKASIITSALNAGYDNRLWQLESVSASAANSHTTMIPVTPAFRGVWSVRISRL